MLIEYKFLYTHTHTHTQLYMPACLRLNTKKNGTMFRLNEIQDVVLYK